MATLTDKEVRTVVRDEIREVKNELHQLHQLLSRIDSKLESVSNLQHEIEKLDINIRQLQGHSDNKDAISTHLQSIDRALNDIQIRVRHSEEMSQYTAGYVAMKLRQKYDREH